MSKTKYIAICGVLTAAAIVLHIIEAMLPNPLPIPGVKLGLANIITLWCIYQLGLKPAFTITVLRTIVSALLLGTFLSMNFLMSISGGIVSMLVMYLAYRLLRKASPIGISILGAASHNMAQLAVAALVIDQIAIFYYLPILFVAALPAGIITGIAVKILLKRLNKQILQL